MDLQSIATARTSFELYPENRLPMFMTIVACSIYTTWVIINVPDAFRAGVAYLALLIVSALAYIASALTGIGRTMDLGDPERAYHAIGLGLAIGFAVVLPLIAKVVTVNMAVSAAMGTAIMALFVCFIAPIVEELFFAGVLLPVFTSIGGVLVGVALTSVMFAVYHYAVYGVSLAAMLYLAMFRAVVSIVQLNYGGIAPGIYAHMVVNMVSYITTVLPQQVMTPVIHGVAGPLGLAAAVALVGGVAMAVVATRWWDTARKVMAGLLVLYAFIGIYALSTMICIYRHHASNPPDTVTVELLGTTMVLPWHTLLVIIACHAILVPWTIATAILLWRDDPAWKTSMLYMTLFALALTTTENAFRGPGTVVVLCICLFDAVTDLVFLALSRIAGEY